MTELKRWVDSGASEGVRELLLAAREERPGNGGVERTLVAVGVGSAVVTGAAHAAGAATAAGGAKSVVTASTALLAVKWGIVGAVSAVATMGAVHVALTASAHRHSAARERAASIARPREIHAAARPPVAEPATESAGAPAAAVAASDVPPSPTVRATLEVAPTNKSGSVQSDSPRMLEEIRAIDRARSALASGDAERCLGAIDEYESAFGERRFQPEALYLRMEAFGKLGDGEGARATAAELLAAFPRAPQSGRAKAVLAQAAP